MDFIILYLDLINYFVEKNFILSSSLFFVFLIIYISLSLPGNLIFFIFSGYLFGLYFGFLINIISIVVGSLNFFIFSKFFFKNFLSNFYNKYSNKISSIISNSSYEYLILLRLIPGPPLMAQNMCLSILNISKTKFILSTFLGFIPLMFLTSIIGSEFSNFFEFKNYDINNLFSYNFLIILFLLIVIFIIKILFKKK